MRGQHKGSELAYTVDQLKNKKNLVDVAIVGSGPAGWSSAVYAARFGYYTLVLAGPVPGGQLTKTSFIENWPGEHKIKGSLLVHNIAEQARMFGANVLQDTVTKIDTSAWPFELTTEQGHVIHAQSVIIATGATPRRLGIPGEQEYWGNGVSTCAVCDAPFFKDKVVVVAGGGDSAAEEAMQLAAHVKQVILVVRKSQMRASHIMRQHLEKTSNITVRYNLEIERVVGDEQGVTAVELRNNKTHELSEQQCSGVFIAIGHDPNSELVKGKVDLLPSGHIICYDGTRQTSVPGIFAAGDVEDHRYRQAGSGAGRGIEAAIDADRFLREVGLTQEVRQNMTKQGGYFEQGVTAHVEIPEIKTPEEFTEKTGSAGFTLVDFFSYDCGPCMTMMPAMEAAAAKYTRQINFYKVDVVKAPELVMKLQVPHVPYVLIYKDGVRVAILNRALGRAELFEQLEQIIK